MSTIETRPSEEVEPRPKYWYEPTVAPSGGDWPQLIKNQWIGTRLPVKSEEYIAPPKALPPPDTDLHTIVAVAGFVKVEAQDAISALRLDGKGEAADFWVSVAKVENWKENAGLYFRLDEGNLIDSETEEPVEVPPASFRENEFEASEQDQTE